MRQEVGGTESKASPFSHTPVPPPTRIRVGKTKESSRTEATNGILSGMKARPKPAAAEANSAHRTRRSLFQNKIRTGGDLGAPPKERETEEIKAVGRLGSRSVEQSARLRRRGEVNCKGAEEDQDSKRKELQKRLDASESLVKELQSEVLALKSELEKLQSFSGELELQSKKLQCLNGELELQNKQFTEDISAANTKISELQRCQKLERVEEGIQQPEFQDIRKLIANKLENLRVRGGEDLRVVKASKVLRLESDPTAKAVGTQAQVSVSVLPPPLPRRPPVRHGPACGPPPPPPPPPRCGAANTQKATGLVEFYHSLTKREREKSPLRGNGNGSLANKAHSSIVGEIQNRSAHLLAIKTDVETKGDFIKLLIQKVQSAAYTDIEDVLNFVDWLDRELSTLADERAVLKHFNWPEKKADTLREAAFEYRDLRRLEVEMCIFEDDASMPYEAVLKKMASLLDKAERSIHRLTKSRDITMLSYRECKVPTQWMLDSGMMSKIKVASMKVAKVYMKRVSMELESVRHPDREPMQEALLLQGVRFAYRVHQFTGGLDSETMCAFEELRSRTHQGGCRELASGITFC